MSYNRDVLILFLRDQLAQLKSRGYRPGDVLYEAYIKEIERLQTT